MIVVYNSDERFASVFATAVLSLFENNKDADEITVYLIENGISEESKAKFQQIAAAYGRTIITLPMPDIEKLAGVDVVIPGYNRMATCGRLFIASLLPADIDKVIYVDCDTVFVDSAAELWDTDITGYAAGMVDCAQNASFRTLLGLSADGIYFNSGLILVNLKYWRENNVERAFLEFIKKEGGYIPFPDEGVLNAVFDGEVKQLPLRYNAMTHIYAYNYRDLFRIRGVKRFYSEEEVESAKREPVLVHFTNNFYLPIRPWMKGCEHPYAQKYLAYKAMTPWKDTPLWDDPRTGIQKLYTKFCHVVPKCLAVESARIITLYITPMKHKYKSYMHMRKLKKQAGGVRLLTNNEANAPVIYLVSAPAFRAVSGKEAA